jgi:membrane-bound lytic murein transglycosylase MltF
VQVRSTWIAIAALALQFGGCSGDFEAPAPSQPPTPSPGSEQSASSASEMPAPAPAPAVQEPEPLTLPYTYADLLEPRFDDLDAMLERRTIRVLVVHSKLFYFIDRGEQRGLTYDALQMFEQDLNRRLKTGTLKVRVVPIPVARDQLLSALAAGRGDIAAAGLTITAERRAQVDFADPIVDGVSEIVVTGPSSPAVSTIDDLGGKTIWVRRSSSYFESLNALSRRLTAAGKPAIDIRNADERLEDEDLIELVAAGILPMTVADSYAAEFWTRIFDNASAHSEIAVRTGGSISWALRKNTPQLRAAVNEFVRTHQQGTRAGNIVLFKYLKDTKWARNAIERNELARLKPMIEIMRRYADQFGFDWLMIAAQAYQESGLDQGKRSHVGAIGVMQVMPTTAADKRIAITGIEKLEPNIHAGTKYLRLLTDSYFNDPAIAEVDRMLFTFAAYNAGPARVQSLRREAPKHGLDPNRWFQNVEVIAARRIGRETVQYVSNIYKYYLAYQLVMRSGVEKQQALEETTG